MSLASLLPFSFYAPCLVSPGPRVRHPPRLHAALANLDAWQPAPLPSRPSPSPFSRAGKGHACRRLLHPVFLHKLPLHMDMDRVFLAQSGKRGRSDLLHSFLPSPLHRPLSPPPASSAGDAIGASTDASLAAAARQLVDEFLRSSMAIGVGGGVGSLAALDYLASKIKAGSLTDVVLVPSSALVASEIAYYGIPMTTLEELKLQQRSLDVAFCDADAVQEGTLYAIIGRKDVPGRGSLVKEKALAQAAKEFLLLVPSLHFVEQLEGDVPVEIEQFNWLEIAEEVDDIFIGDAEVWRRPASGEAGPMGGDFPLVTEDGHFVLDIRFDTPILKPEDVAKELSAVPGVVAHGVLLDEAKVAAVAYPDGVKIRTSLFRASFSSS